MEMEKKFVARSKVDDFPSYDFADTPSAWAAFEEFDYWWDVIPEGKTYDDLLEEWQESHKKVYLGNALSLQMINTDIPSDWVLEIKKVSPEDIPVDAISCIGHQDTANVLSGILGRDIPCNRRSVFLNNKDTLYVAQLTGGRLPEGTTTLPQGFKFKFLKVTVKEVK